MLDVRESTFITQRENILNYSITLKSSLLNTPFP